MNNSTYHLIINAFRVGTWLQTAGFYFVLFLMVHVLISQFKLMPARLPVDIIPNNDEEIA